MIYVGVPGGVGRRPRPTPRDVLGPRIAHRMKGATLHSESRDVVCSDVSGYLRLKRGARTTSQVVPRRNGGQGIMCRYAWIESGRWEVAHDMSKAVTFTNGGPTLATPMRENKPRFCASLLSPLFVYVFRLTIAIYCNLSLNSQAATRCVPMCQAARGGGRPFWRRQCARQAEIGLAGVVALL